MIACKIVDYLIWLTLTLLMVWFGLHTYSEKHSIIMIGIVILICWLISAFFCDLFHEVGHLLFGLCNDFAFNSLHIGFINIYRKQGRLSVTIKPIFISIAGCIEMLPKNSKNLHVRFRRMVFGGLLFSFILALGSTLCFAFFPRLPFIAYVFTCTIWPYSVHLLFCNLLPQESNDQLYSDGAMYWGLLRKDASCLTTVNVLAVEGYMYAGRSPAEIGKELYFGLPQLSEDDLNFMILTDYRLMYFLDAGQLDHALAASDRLNSILCYIPIYYYRDIAADIMYCECAIRGDCVAADDMLGYLHGYLECKNTVTANRILAAAMLYIDEDKESATKYIERALKKAEECAIPGYVKFEKKLIERIQKDMELC